MDESDWEPLPPEQLGLHPATEVELKKVRKQPASSPDRPLSAAEQHLIADEFAQQARALLALQQRLEAVPPTRTLVDGMRERERRQHRRTRAASRPELGDVMVKSAIVPPQVPSSAAPFADAGSAAEADGRNSHGDEAWLEALPEHARDRLDAALAHELERSSGAAAAQRRNRGRRAALGIAVFAVVCALGTPGASSVTACAGVLCSIVWSRIAPCRYRDAMVALCCFFGVAIAAWLLHGAAGPLPGTFLDVLLLVPLAALVGFDGEIRRSGGFDAK